MKRATATTTVEDYLASLPDDRRRALTKLRSVLRKHIPKGYVESHSFGMIAWAVPLAVYPDTYNGQPLCYAALASQKHHMSLYLMCAYAHAPLRKKLEDGFRAAGKQLDMGKACIRFKSLEDLPLDVIADIAGAVPVAKYVETAKQAHAQRK